MEFAWKYGKNEISECYEVRKKVFVDEQGFDGEAEFDNLDEVSFHILVKADDFAIATARLFKTENGFHCGRICVLKEYRKKGIGLFLMQQLEAKTIELGGNMLELSAQVRAENFYLKAGYLRFGEVYLDENCPHIAMKKVLY